MLWGVLLSLQKSSSKETQVIVNPKKHQVKSQPMATRKRQRKYTIIIR